ncbi:Anti-sigma regulatory factor [Petrocella atlantisensis]|uniref:Anti-sigma regulatory factor n=1 Tax=Petrocella atlantisensis TaxID=2173034 RepID=A0A3P7NSR9_9FIRM|nr:ATP-binding protein [Petrocella atlantisensis]MCF8020344.1 ATP-binding protein [Vallitaleaceae bacterium]PKM54488.1 MAG: anti-sigma regulatory factor [Firmicutes bacterium HGW-Firmicutes-5]VDN45945.1 Anti-sigma regulatory factor [Petrocella atlantisensis]
MNLHFDVEGGEFISAGVASSKVKKVLKQLAIQPEIIRKISVAMYEAEINMVIHAHGGVIDAEIMPDHVHVVLKDEGPGIENIELAMKAGYSTASRLAREMGFGAGMGLANMKRYADILQIESEPGKGTTVEITVKLYPEQQ